MGADPDAAAEARPLVEPSLIEPSLIEPSLVEPPLAELVETIRAHSAGRAVVLIDGRSGSGKTGLASRLAPLLDAQLVSLDDLYPGWDGLEAGSRAVHETVLRAQEPGWVRWDWTSERAAEWHPLDPARALVIEGCGTLSRANRSLATFGIWIELDAAERRRRATRRDGGRFDSFWDRWAAQETDVISRENPRALADLVLEGSAPDGSTPNGSTPVATAFQVRLARHADLPGLKEIQDAADAMFVELFGSSTWPAAPRGEQRAALAGFILVAVDAADRVVGFAQVIDLGDGAHLEQLSVLPAHGRQGIGRALVDAAKSEAHRRGHAVMTLRTYAAVPWNGPFYASCGFEESVSDAPELTHSGAMDAERGLEQWGRRILMSASLG